MRTKHILLTTAAAVLLGGVARADHHENDKLPKKPYDPQRQIGLDKPWEIGSPGKKKYDPKEKSDTAGKYSKRDAGTKDEGAYAPIERKTVVKYSDMVVKANKSIKSAGSLYGLAIKPIFFDEEANLVQVQEAQDNLTARVKKVQKVMKAYNLPKTKGAVALNKAHMVFLDYQKKMVEGSLDEIMDLLEDPNLKPEHKKEEIQKLLDEMQKEEAKHYLALKKAQDAYGEAHGIKIIHETIVQPDGGKKDDAKGKMKKGYTKKAS